jgi:hypothetical protein
VTFMHYDLASSITKNGARRMRADPFEAGVTCASGMDIEKLARPEGFKPPTTWFEVRVGERKGIRQGVTG